MVPVATLVACDATLVVCGPNLVVLVCAFVAGEGILVAQKKEREGRSSIDVGSSRSSSLSVATHPCSEIEWPVNNTEPVQSLSDILEKKC